MLFNLMDYQISANGIYKIALSYSNNNIVFYVNGFQRGIDTNATIPNCDKIDLGQELSGQASLSDGIKNVALFKTRLTDAECIALTTL